MILVKLNLLSSFITITLTSITLSVRRRVIQAQSHAKLVPLDQKQP